MNICDDFLGKPLNQSQLVHSLKGLLKHTIIEISPNESQNIISDLDLDNTNMAIRGLQDIPVEVLGKLRVSLVALDEESITELTRQIREINPVLADKPDVFSDNFQYEQTGIFLRLIAPAPALFPQPGDKHGSL